MGQTFLKSPEICESRVNKVLLKDPPRLAFFDRPATPEFWDSHWRTSALKQRIRQSKGDSIVVPRIVRHVAAGGIVLEAGCGQALLVHALGVHGFRSIGVDYAVSTLEAVKAACPDLEVYAADVRRLPFKAGTFDAYVSLGVIEHFWDGYEQVRDEMARVLKPGGYLLLSFPHISLLRQWKIMMGLYRGSVPLNPKDSFYQFALDAKCVQRDMEAAGFELIEKCRYDGIKGFKDECPLARAWLQRVHDGHPTRLRKPVDRLLRTFASHMCILCFRRS